MFGDSAQVDAPTLGFDDAADLAVDEQHVVGWAGASVHFMYSNAQLFVKVDALFNLNCPAGRLEFFAYLFAGFGFELWVFW